MRLPILVPATAVVLGVVAAGCGGGTEGTDSSSAGAGGGAASGDGGAKKLALGDSTTLKGLNGSMEVKVLKVEDPMKAPPARGLIRETPRKGYRFVGVH